MALPQFLTLDQMLKNVPQNRPDAALMMTRFRESVFLDTLAFKTLPGQSGDTWIEATDLPVTERRGLNEDFTSSGGGRDEPNTSPMKIYGIRLTEDRQAAKMGLSDTTSQDQKATRSISLTLESDAIVGDPEATPKAVTGLQFHAENSGASSVTSISAGATAGGEALSLLLLRNAIDECINPEKIVLSQPMLNQLTGASENTGVTGFLTHAEADFGKRRFFFDNLPLVAMEKDAANNRILDFVEASFTGDPTSTSIYVTGEGYSWFQNGPPEIDPMATVSTQAPREITWLLGNRATQLSVIRIKHIANLTVVR